MKIILGIISAFGAVYFIDDFPILMGIGLLIFAYDMFKN